MKVGDTERMAKADALVRLSRLMLLLAVVLAMALLLF
jgi:hypothetical protein